jgi:hypothetical protein
MLVISLVCFVQEVRVGECKECVQERRVEVKSLQLRLTAQYEANKCRLIHAIAKSSGRF